jgi:hypothetical protein
MRFILCVVAAMALSVFCTLLCMGRLEVSVTFGKDVQTLGRTDTRQKLVANLTHTRKEAPPRIRTQGIIDSKELGNRTEPSLLNSCATGVVNISTKLAQAMKAHHHGNADLVVVTGASSNHFGPLKLFLNDWSNYSRSRPEYRNVPLVIYDLGLSKVQKKQLLKSSYPFQVDWRYFVFANYPEFFRIDVARGEYAWKGVIIHEVQQQCNSSVLWLDSGAGLALTSLLSLSRMITSFGVASSRTQGTIRKWVHGGTLQYLVPELMQEPTFMVRP